LLKAHPLYTQAKAGMAEAAVDLISHIALPFIAQISNQLPSEAWYVAPHAREATGDNAIPQVLAAACASAVGGLIDTDIVQISRVFHTGADPMERMASRPDFEGIVIPGADYVLVDDVTTMGGNSCGTRQLHPGAGRQCGRISRAGERRTRRGVSPFPSLPIQAKVTP
jgi:hypothetical protein